MKAHTTALVLLLLICSCASRRRVQALHEASWQTLHEASAIAREALREERARREETTTRERCTTEETALYLIDEPADSLALALERISPRARLLGYKRITTTETTERAEESDAVSESTQREEAIARAEAIHSEQSTHQSTEHGETRSTSGGWSAVALWGVLFALVALTLLRPARLLRLLLKP